MNLVTLCNIILKFYIVHDSFLDLDEEIAYSYTCVSPGICYNIYVLKMDCIESCVSVNRV